MTAREGGTAEMQRGGWQAVSPRGIHATRRQHWRSPGTDRPVLRLLLSPVWQCPSPTLKARPFQFAGLHGARAFTRH